MPSHSVQRPRRRPNEGSRQRERCHGKHNRKEAGRQPLRSAFGKANGKPEAEQRSTYTEDGDDRLPTHYSFNEGEVGRDTRPEAALQFSQLLSGKHEMRG